MYQSYSVRLAFAVSLVSIALFTGAFFVSVPHALADDSVVATVTTAPDPAPAVDTVAPAPAIDTSTTSDPTPVVSDPAPVVVTNTSTDTPPVVDTTQTSPDASTTPTDTATPPPVVDTSASDTPPASTSTTTDTTTTTVDTSSLPAAVISAYNPTLTTDKADYAPGSTATIFGSFFNALQNYVLKIFGYDQNGNNYTESTQNVTADASGAFTTTYTLENFYRPLYTVSASTPDGTQVAQTTFTDAKVLSVTKNGTGSGTVTSSGGTGSINCGATCSSSFGNNDTVILTAAPIAGDYVSAWSVPASFNSIVGCAAASTSCQFNLNGNAGTVTVTFSHKLNQAITVTTAAPASAVYNTTFPVVATSSSGIAVAITATGGCSIAGGTVTMMSGTASCVVHYNQAGNITYNAAPEVTSTTTATPKSITATVTANNKTYDGTISATVATCTPNNLVGSDVVTCSASGAIFSDRNAANGKTVTATGIALGGANASNYTLSSTSATATANISKLAITVTAATNSKTYDGNTNAIATPTIAPALGTGDTSSFTESYQTAIVGTGKTLVPAGTVTDGNTGNNYTVTFINNTTGVISAKAVTPSVTATGKTYDGTISATIATCSLSGVVSPDIVLCTAASGSYADKNAGVNKTVTASGIALEGADAGNYSLSSGSATATATISARPITVSAVTNTKTYDANTTAAATPTVTSGTVIAGDSGSFTESYSDANAGVGNKTLIPAGSVTDGNGGANYAVTFVNFSTGTINPKTVTVTADPQTKVFGASDLTLTYVGSGLIVPDVFSGSLSRAPGENVGTYAIDQGTLTAGGNYTIHFTGDTFAITPATASITVTPYAVTYDGSPHTATKSATGVGGADLSADVDVSGTLHTVAGTYATDAWTFHDPAGNYADKSGTVSDSIAQASSVTTISCPASVTYTGLAQTPCSATVTGAGGLSLTPTPTYSANTNVGTANAAHTFAGDTNHTGSTDSKNFAISPATAAITVTSYSVTYNALPHTATVVATGAQGEDLSADVTLSGTTHTPAGDYPADAWSFHDPNGNYADASGTVHDAIAQKAASVTPDAKTKVYGEADPALTGTLSGFIPADGVSATYSRDGDENVGTKTISATLSPAGVLGNYNITSNTANFTITKAAVTVTADPKTKTYGTVDPTLTYQITSGALVGADAFTGALTRDLGENVGDYNITQGTLALSGNYDLTYVGDKLSITKKDINVKVDAGQGKVYGATDPALTSTNDPLVGSDVYSGSLHRAPGEDVGTYAIDQGTLTAGGNYTIHFTGADFAITPATASITVTPYAVTYDGNPHTAAKSATGVGGADLSADVDVSGTTHTDAGTYATDGWSFHDPAGNYSDANGTVSDSITKADPTIVVTPYSVTYDASAHTADSSAKGAKGEDLSGLDVSATTHTNAGDYPTDAWTFTDSTGNYNNKSGTVADAIAKADATFNVVGYTGIYDALPHGASGTAKGVANVDLSAGLNFGATFTNVSGGTAHWTFDGGTNYSNQSGDVPIVINKKDASVTPDAKTKVYAEADPALTGTLSGFIPADGVSATYSRDGDENVGTKTISATLSPAEVLGNYNVTYHTADFTITKADSSTVVTCPATPQVYTGSAQEPCTAAVTGAGGLSTDATVNYTDNTNVGTAHASATYAGDANHNGSDGSSTFDISEASSTTVVTCPADVTYNGDAQTPCTVAVTGVGGLSLTPTPDYTNNTNAGTAHAAYAFAGDANHSGSSDTKDFTIKKADASITVTPYAVTYNGNPHTATVAATGAKGEDLSLDVNLSGTAHTAAGDYPSDAWAFTDATGNYNNSNGTVHDSIDKAKATIAVTPYAVTYDGDAHTAAGSATGVNSEDLGSELTVSGTTHTDAGTYASDSWTFAGDANYQSDSGTVSDSIAKAAAVIAVTDYTGTYDGGAHGTTGTATGVKGEALSGLDLGATFTNVPGGTAHWTFTDATGNYKNDSGDANVTISKAKAVIAVTPYSIPFDGSAHTAVGTATGVTHEDLSSLLDLSGTTHTDAGTYTTDPWTFSGNGNYDSDSGTVSDAISPVGSVTTVTCPASVTYDGTAHTPCSATVTGAGGLSLTPTPDYTNNTNAGIAHAAYAFVGDANHSGSTDNKDFTIGQATATINVLGFTGAYDGSAHGASGTAKGIADVDLSAGLNFGTTFTNVPGGTAHWTFHDAAGNYADESGDAAIIINKSDPTIVVTPYSVPFDGSAHTAAGSAKGVLGETLSGLDLSGTTHTAAADYPTDPWTFTDATGNYNNANATVSDSIGAASSVTTVTCPASVVYSGSAQTPCTASVTGDGGLNQPVTVNYTANTDAGTAHASATFAGDANHSGSSDSKDFDITKAAITVTADPQTKVYGATDSAFTYKVTSGAVLGTDTFTGSLTRDLGENVGAYNITQGTLALSNNYNLSYIGDTLSITPATATVTVTPYAVAYDGTQHAATVVAGGVHAENLSTDVNVTATQHTNADDYPADAWTFHDAAGNYADQSGSVHDSIAKTNATVVVSPYTVTFDGNPHTAAGSAKGVLGETLSGLDLSGTTHTAAADYPTDPWTFTDATGNYNNASGSVHDSIAQSLGSLLITKNTFGGNGTFNFSGTGLSPFSIATLGNTGTNLISGLVAGAYIVNEAPLSGWVKVDSSCDGIDDSGAVVDAGAQGTCTFTNAAQGHIIVKKVTVGGTGTFNFTSSYNPSGFTLSGGQQNDSGLIDPSVAGTATVAGDYSVSEDTPDGWTLATSCDNGNDPAAITLNPGQTVTCTFTNTKNSPTNQKGVITGMKFEDLNGDGVQQTNEPAVNGVTIYLDLNNNGVKDKGDKWVVTKKDGTYTFKNVAPGTYVVREVTKRGWVQTYPASGSYTVTVSAGQTVSGKNFGNFKLGTISGFKFEDKNHNGVKDPTEKRLKGWTIQLKKGATVVQTATTDEGGRYRFMNVGPGTYTVAEVQQTGWKQWTVNPVPILMTSRLHSTGNNFGNAKL